MKGLGREGVQLSVSCLAPVQCDLKTLSQPRLCAVGVKGRLYFTLVGGQSKPLSEPLLCALGVKGRSYFTEPGTIVVMSS